MPSGQTHDRITLWGLPCVTGISFGLTQSGNLTLLISGAFLFSGLMFGPDLDIISVQYKRWGILRWIWRPYQKTIQHRSLLSHGLLIGTVLRLLYLAIWLSILSIFVLGLAQLIWDIGWNWQDLVQVARRSLTQHSVAWLSLVIGLELGAISHSLSDWGVSAYKRRKKTAESGWLSRGKIIKQRQSNSITRRRHSTTVKSRRKS